MLFGYYLQFLIGWLLIKKALHLSMKRFREPDWIRTNDPQLRRLMLYPTELPVPFF